MAGYAGFSQMNNAISAFNTDSLTQKVSAVINVATGLAQAFTTGGPLGAALYAVTSIAGAIVGAFEENEKRLNQEAEDFTKKYDENVKAATENAKKYQDADTSFSTLNN